MQRNRPCGPALLLLTLVLSSFGLLGCPRSVKRQLESVARDWSAMIRASQIIPVYPLTEDIQPGDIFLVQVPIDRQQEIYEKDGYLPLDNHLDRINPTGYAAFYARSFDLPAGSGGSIPRDLLKPGADRKGAWSVAPGASFPTYSFVVKRDMGINLAVPLQGVPVGLSLLQSKEAVGSVSIRKARTLGVDTLSLYTQLVSEWWPWKQALLRPYARQPEQPLQQKQRLEQSNYLRVITRVYLAGEVDISLDEIESAGGGADVKTPKPLELLMSGNSTQETATLDKYQENLDKLNKTLSGGAGSSGGSVRITAASARSIGLKETLDPPLVIGYLGFDVEILPDGKLGPPIPTHARLVGQTANSDGPANVLTGYEERYAKALDAAIARADEGRAVLAQAVETLGPGWVTLYKRRLGGGADYADAFGDLALAYWTGPNRETDVPRQGIVVMALEAALSAQPPN